MNAFNSTSLTETPPTSATDYSQRAVGTERLGNGHAKTAVGVRQLTSVGLGPAVSAIVIHVTPWRISDARSWARRIRSVTPAILRTSRWQIAALAPARLRASKGDRPFLSPGRRETRGARGR